MPVRVRCPECEKVVNAPDAARGKAVKCPQCQTRISVPASEEESSSKGKAAKPAAKSSVKPAAKKKAAPESDEFLAKLDLSRSEDRNTRVCPKCGTVVDEEDLECAACGVDLQTGGLGKTAKKARMKWADPNDFYPLAWKDGAAFVRENFQLIVKSWGNVVFLMACSAAAGGLGALFGKYGHTPSVIFFAVLAALASLGTYGWFLSLSAKVIHFTLDKKLALDRTNFEIFTAMATGVSWVIWFIASAIPFSVIIFPVYLFTKNSGDAVNYGVTAAVALFFVCLPMPAVMAHRAMPVNWMIWVSPLMWKVAVKTIGGVLYCWLVAFVTWLPVALCIALELFVAKKLAVGMLEGLGMKDSGLAAQAASAGFPMDTGSLGVVAASFVLLLVILLRLLTTFAYTVWAMYMLRVVAQYTFYNKRNLELISQVKEKKYVAKQVELGPDGEPIHKGNAGLVWGGGILGTILFYVIANVILYFVAPGYLLMPRPIAVLLRLVN